MQESSLDKLKQHLTKLQQDYEAALCCDDKLGADDLLRLIEDAHGELAGLIWQRENAHEVIETSDPAPNESKPEVDCTEELSSDAA